MEKNNDLDGTRAPGSKPDNREDAVSSCCGDSCCAEEQSTVVLENGAHGTKFQQTQLNPSNYCDDDCCGGEGSTKEKNEEGSDCCEDGCCAGESTTEPTKEKKVDERDCCVTSDVHGLKNQDGTCCNTTCLEKVALRECRQEHEGYSDLPKSSKHGKANHADKKSASPGCAGSDCCNDRASNKSLLQTACDYHLQSIYKRFAPSLVQLGCICRDLIENNLPRCCSITPPSSKHRSLRRRRKHCSKTGVQRMGQSESRSMEATKRLSVGTSSCCSSSEGSVHTPRNSGEERRRPSLSDDLERGPTNLEHVLLTVQGMTCSGCEKNLRNALRTIKTIKNIQTSLILARAEFDIDISSITVDEALVVLKRKTTYSYSRVVESKHNQGLDLLVPAADQARFCEMIAQQPPGVTDIVAWNQQTVRVSYNAHVIGARKLLEVLESMWNQDRQSTRQRLVLAPLPDHPAIAAGRRQVRKEGLYFFSSAMLTIPVLVFSWASFSMKDEHQLAFDAASLALATIIQAGVAYEIYPAALKSLFHSKLIEMDLLIMLSTTAAYVFSVVAFGYFAVHRPLQTGQFFETSTLLVTLIMLGRFVSEVARQKATESISIRSLQPAKALLLDLASNTTQDIDSRLLQYEDIFRIIADSRIVTDGEVIRGGSEVDESMVTGESTPVAKGIGSKVIAGSVNTSGTLDILLTKLPWENTISTIASMVDEAELSKPKAQKLADKIAGYFVPVIAIITLVVFVIWVFVGKFAKHLSASEAAINATIFAIATLIVSCPCAIGLAVPMVVVIANGVAAKHGIILKQPQTIENAKRVTHAVFDKTGTLTEDHMAVVSEQYLEVGLPEERVKSLLLSLMTGNNHPVSKAIAAHVEAQIGSATHLAQNVKVVTGKGVEGTYHALPVQAGNCQWLGLAPSDLKEHLSEDSQSIFCFRIGENLAAVFGLSNTLRPETRTVLDKLRKRNIQISILSGDDANAVSSIASQLDVPISRTRSRYSPADKARYIKTIQKADPKATVLFCGDGTNDAVALKQANIGVHMSEGSDIAQGAADVVLVRADLNSIIDLLNISKAAYRRIIFNFIWSAVYNVSAVLLAGGVAAEANVRIPPEFAGLGEIVSVLPVIAVAVQLRFVGFGR